MSKGIDILLGESESKEHLDRMKQIGQNGNSGEHYTNQINKLVTKIKNKWNQQ